MSRYCTLAPAEGSNLVFPFEFGLMVEGLRELLCRMLPGRASLPKYCTGQLWATHYGQQPFSECPVDVCFVEDRRPR